MSDEKYNGWRNYETWAVNLWLTNDSEVGYKRWYERAQVLKSTMSDNRARYALAGELKSVHEDRARALRADGSVFSDLIQHSLDRVDWEEVAQSLLAD